MNLTTDPWIPVIDGDGVKRQVSLIDAFHQGDSLRDLAVHPPQRIALMRLLICIAQAALDGPETELQWSQCHDDITATAIAYLKEHEGSFDLYGSRPFLQVPELESKHNAVLDKLDFGLAAGNGPTLFDQNSIPEGRPQDPAWQALMLLTYQCFCPGGLIGDNTWGGKATGRTSTHSPCIESSPLHLLLRRSNLLDTLHLNLITKEQLTLLNIPWGAPIWELLPFTPDSPAAKTATTTYLGRLVPLSRAIKLEPGATTFTLANGLDYPKMPEYREPTPTVIKKGKKEELGYLGIDLAKHPWRELGSILHHNQNGHAGPLALKHLEVLKKTTGTLDIWTGGLAADRAKLLDTAEWTFSITTNSIGDDWLTKYESGVDLARNAAARLGDAIRAYCKEMNCDNTFNGKARSAFWSILDADHQILLDTAFDDSQDLDITWYPVVRQAMTTAYRQTCPHESPRQMQAFAIGADKLRLKKIATKKAGAPA